jgi:cytochrome c553
MEVASRMRDEARVCVMLAAVWRPLLIGLAVATVSMGETSAQGVAERARPCGTCHGEDGNSGMPNIPSLAGQPEFFIINQLFLMREGVRKVEAMAALVKDLKDDDLQALAKHYAAQPAKASGEPIDAALAQRGAEIAGPRRCVSCHQPSLAGADQIPRIAKQRVDYLTTALKEFRDGRRPGADTLMSAAVAGLSDADLTALAHFAASR